MGLISALGSIRAKGKGKRKRSQEEIMQDAQEMKEELGIKVWIRSAPGPGFGFCFVMIVRLNMRRHHTALVVVVLIGPEMVTHACSRGQSTRQRSFG